MARKALETTKEERKIILKLHSEGKSYAEIGKVVNRNRFTIRSIIKRFKNTSSTENSSRSGRPRKLTLREEAKVVRSVKKNPQKTSTNLAAEVKEDFNKDIHPKTVRRLLNRAGYNSRIARKKPFISPANKKKHLEFAKLYKNEPLDFWDKVLFSDESKFNIFQSDGRLRVWRKPNSEFDEQNVVKTIKHGGGGVLVWGCMAASVVGKLVFIDQIMDKTLYMNILKENLKESAQILNLGDHFYFQQDNDPKHTAYDVRMWIIHNVPHMLATPPQSPDLNPIEHLWDELGRRVAKRNISTKTELKQILQDEWSKICLETTKKLVHSMPGRLQEVIKRKGLNTRY